MAAFAYSGSRQAFSTSGSLQSLSRAVSRPPDRVRGFLRQIYRVPALQARQTGHSHTPCYRRLHRLRSSPPNTAVPAMVRVQVCALRSLERLTRIGDPSVQAEPRLQFQRC
jgi:hypothetical protein